MALNHTIENHWQRFATAVIAPAAPPVEVSEMRLSFYAGCTVFLGVMQEIDEPGVSEADGVAQLEALMQEAHSTFEALGKAVR
ncbi:MAG: hypothetical protein EOO27_13825 [Comamonadaceae bacterium]|nr:MAG: hypothetical protein EOO27_13825 [Comamonadaceae bacterium]